MRTSAALLAFLLFPLASALPACGGPPRAPLTAASTPNQSWSRRSDDAIRPYLDWMKRTYPEGAGRLGYEDCDEEIRDLTPGFRLRLAAELRAVKGKLERQLAGEKEPALVADLSIAIRAADLQLREAETDEQFMLPSWNAARQIYSGLRPLLEDRITPERRQKALKRFRKYVGLEPGTTPLVELMMLDYREHLTRPNLVPPTRAEVEKALATSSILRDGIGKLFEKYGIQNYQDPLRALGKQLDAYDEFVRKNVLPRARDSFVLPPEVYALMLENAGVSAPIDQLIADGHREFDAIQEEMQKVAKDVAKVKGFGNTDYRDVLRQLKKQTQITGEAILPLYEKRLAEIEEIVRREHLVTLPSRRARIRIASDAESAQQPAPHMNPARLVGNTGEAGEFVLPLNIPAGTGTKSGESTYDDFTYDAIAWTLTSHELRPGHELQFDAMLDKGVSIARAVLAQNSANVEGWALYAETIMYPFMPPEGKLASLQFRLQRAARLFIDPELQRGKWTFDSAREFLKSEVGLSHAFATSEVERYTFLMPGQATSYMYGLLKMRALRADAERALGAKFDAHLFHDTILAEGAIPPDLLRQAVLSKLGATKL